MILQNLQVQYFKNYKDVNIHFDPRINIITGDNGAGKTNVLDAIHYLSFTKSFLNHSDTLNINYLADYFSVYGKYFMDSDEANVLIYFHKHEKKIIKKNSIAYDKISEHIGLIPLIIISPVDSDIIWEGSEFRRKLVDFVLSQTDKNYLHHIIRYNRALIQRNNAIKQVAKNKNFGTEAIELWNEPLVLSGKYIFEQRKRLIEYIKPVMNSLYAHVSGSKENIDIEYQTNVSYDHYLEQLFEKVQDDLYKEFTTIGVHKDDVVFYMNEQVLKRFASQGQQKTFIISLKLAFYEYIVAYTQKHPLLLLDDITDKLDEGRLNNLFTHLKTMQNTQIFITDTSIEKLQKHLFKTNQSFTHFIVKENNIWLENQTNKV